MANTFPEIHVGDEVRFTPTSLEYNAGYRVGRVSRVGGLPAPGQVEVVLDRLLRPIRVHRRSFTVLSALERLATIGVRP